MTEQEKIRTVKDFVESHTLGVLSTVTADGLPESAAVGFSETEDLVLYFGTYNTARKYQNLQRNSKVSVVIGWERGKTVQYEGDALEITDSAEIEQFKQIHLAKIPSAAKYVSASEERFFKITPKWIRYSDLSVDPWDIWEIKF